MKILKFGGTSVGSPEALEKIVFIVKNKYKSGEVLAVVVSAFSGVTNKLIEMAHLAETGNDAYQSLHKSLENRHIETISSLFPAATRSSIIAQVMRLTNELDDILNGISLIRECTPRTLDLVVSFGERLSALTVKNLFELNGIACHSLDARDVVKTNRQFGSASPLNDISFRLIQSHFEQKPGMAIVTGFIASSENNETTTLGRGGSDFTAAIFGAALHVDEILIYTDVNGMMTTDPRIVPDAFTISQISYQEAMELSHFGAKVIYPPTLKPAFDKKIPLRIVNTFEPDNAGTLITEVSKSHDFSITGLSSIKEVVLINVQGSGLQGVAGFASRLFSALGKERINIILITQASSEHSISLAVSALEAENAQKAIEVEFQNELKAGHIDPLELQKEVSILAIIGENMKNSPGVSGKLFGALGRNGINVTATAQGSSELNISIVIARKDLEKALNALHQTFFSTFKKVLNLFLVGPGLIGKTFLRQLDQQKQYLEEKLNLSIRLHGLANSKKMLISEQSIEVSNWETELNEKGEKADLYKFKDSILKLNLPNSVIADCTALPVFTGFYTELLEKSVAIVTPNKIANSGTYAQYKALQDSALKGNTRFLYETNVGAGLPVIQTLKNLAHSGDEVLKIEAMLSGTLSFIFNQFKPGVKFKDVVWAAKEAGYTEPDPRDDLSGKDIARKILILARESGLKLEPEDVVPENILPKSCVEAATVDKFFETLDQENAYFENIVEVAANEGKKVKFICKLENGKVSIKLESIGPEHPFSNSNGADNIIAFYTSRYTTRPMLIQGPGAGAEVTAAGVFGDVILLAG